MDFYADEILKNMRADHDKIMDALDQLRGEKPGTLARESDKIVAGVHTGEKDTRNQKSFSDKKSKA
jgi:hypothetical protein